MIVAWAVGSEDAPLIGAELAGPKTIVPLCSVLMQACSPPHTGPSNHIYTDPKSLAKAFLLWVTTPLSSMKCQGLGDLEALTSAL